MTRRTEWVRCSDASRLAKRILYEELSELAIEFAARPDEQWTGEEIAAVLKLRLAKRKKFGISGPPTDELPSNAVRMQIP